jgi:hypothetical protein
MRTIRLGLSIMAALTTTHEMWSIWYAYGIAVGAEAHGKMNGMKSRCTGSVLKCEV